MPRPAAELACRLAREAETVCRHYLFNGRRHGRYWLVGDVATRSASGSRPFATADYQAWAKVALALEVGELTQIVEVTAETPLVQTGTSSLGQVVETRAVTELPLNVHPTTISVPVL